MKKTITLFLFVSLHFLICSTLAGQAHILHPKLSAFSNLAIGPEQIAAGGAGVQSCRQARLNFFDYESMVLWEDVPHLGGDYHPMDMIWRDNELIVVGYVGQFTEIISEIDSMLFFARYSATGELLQLEEFQNVFFAENPRKLIDSWGGFNFFLMATESEIYFIGNDGNINPSYWGLPENVRGVAGWDSYILVHSENSIRLHTIEQNEPVFDYISEDDIFDMIVFEGAAWWVTRGHLYRYEMFDMGPAIIPIPENTGQLKLTAKDNLLLVYETALPDQAKGWWIDANTNDIMPAFDWEMPDIYMYDLEIVNADSVTLVGLTQPTPNFPNSDYLWQGFLLKTPFATFNNTSEFDIGVSNVSLELTDEPNIIDDDPIFAIQAPVEATVEVTNYGDTVVNEFIITSQVFWKFNCVAQRLFQAVEDANLAPGETKTYILSGTFFDEKIGEIPEILVRFTTSAPNHQFDGNPENDTNFDVIVDTKEVLKVVPKVKLLPNPAQSTFEVTSTAKIQAISLFNSSGSLIRQVRPTGAFTVQLERGQAPPGLYFVKIQTSEGQVTHKLIWQ